MRVRKSLIGGLIALVFLVALGMGDLFIVAIRERDRARAFLQDVASLPLGTATFADAQQLAKKYDGKPWNGPSREPTCTVHDCAIRFIFENKMLNHLQRNKREVSLAAGLIVKDGLVVTKEINLSVLTTTWSTQFVYVLFDRVSSTAPQGYKVERLKVDGSGMPHLLQVELGPAAPTAMRKNAYSLDLSCLAKVRDCDTSNTVFPRGL